MEDYMTKRKPAGHEVEISRDRLAELLNEDLSREYQAIIAYVVYSQVLTGAAYTDIAAQLELHAKQELDHALIISRQIDYLGKMPAVTPKPVRTSKDPRAMLRFDLDNENETVRNYRDRIRQCEALGEYAMAEQIRQILVQEQDHQIDLATALGEEVPDVSGGLRGRPLRRRR
jgi:bacterioferritin